MAEAAASAAAAPRTLSIDGRTLAYHVRGAAPVRRRVVWIDGTPSSRIPWYPGGAAVRRLGLEVLTVDRPGYGRSTPQPGRTVHDGAGDLVRLLDHLSWETADVVGVSNGGAFALALAALAPDRVRTVFAVGSASPSVAGNERSEAKRAALALLRDDPHAYRARLDSIAEQVRVDPVPALIAAVGDVAPRDAALLARRDVADRFVRSMREATAQGGEGWFEDHVAVNRDWGVDVDAVTGPVVFLHGGRDTVCPPSGVEALARRLGATVRLDPEDGHLSPLERLEDALAAT